MGNLIGWVVATGLLWTTGRDKPALRVWASRGLFLVVLVMLALNLFGVVAAWNVRAH